MAQPTQPPRYLTRARAKAEDNTVDGRLPYQWKGQRAAEKRKASAIADTEASASSDTSIPVSRSTRPSKRTVPNPTEETAGVKTAPKRKSNRNGDLAAKKTVATKKLAATATTKSLKKVTFNDDKENLVPLRGEDEKMRHQRDDTDELMSTSMGALSVKPLRVPSTKLRLPSTSTTIASAFDPLPALSPSKARRPPRVLTIEEDEEMEDELSSPMSPILKLSAKPKRGQDTSTSSQGLLEATGATNLRKPLDLSASLLTSPARRPPASPFKPTTANTPFLKSNVEDPNIAIRPLLASPARRPPFATITGLGSPIKGGSRLEPKMTLGVEIPDLSKAGFRSPPKRAKVSNFVKMDGSEDELGMDLDDYMLSRSPSRPVKRNVASEELFGGFAFGHTGAKPMFEIDDPKQRTRPKSPTTTTRSIAPPTGTRILEKRDAISETQHEHMQVGKVVDIDENAILGYLVDTDNLVNQMSPTTKKSNSGTERVCVHGFFGLGAEDDETSNPQHTEDAFSAFSGMDFQSGRKNLFPHASVSSRLEDGIPIDPLLLTLGVPDDFLGVVESPSRKTTVPVKLHSVDDVMNDDGHDIEQENQLLPSKPGASTKKTRENFGGRTGGIVRTSNVLAGAVVFVDVYTSEGADASAAFVEALRGLGAKVIRSWNWNPNSTGGPGDGERKVGITHVVFKDGSPRTLQKVKDSKGVVLCVGVGWVTSCEEEQAWIDESIYPVDLNHIPRGGHRRRKSMEPKALIGIPGNNSISSSISDKMIFSLPPKTPKPSSKTLFFPRTEQPQKPEGELNPLLMKNLLMAQRKSMQFAPKVGSPLRRFAALAME